MPKEAKTHLSPYLSRRKVMGEALLIAVDSDWENERELLKALLEEHPTPTGVCMLRSISYTHIQKNTYLHFSSIYVHQCIHFSILLCGPESGECYKKRIEAIVWCVHMHGPHIAWCTLVTKMWHFDVSTKWSFSSEIEHIVNYTYCDLLDMLYWLVVVVQVGHPSNT